MQLLVVALVLAQAGASDPDLLAPSSTTPPSATAPTNTTAPSNSTQPSTATAPRAAIDPSTASAPPASTAPPTMTEAPAEPDAAPPPVTIPGTIAPLWASREGNVTPEVKEEVRAEVRRTLAASGLSLLDEALVQERLAGRDPSDCRSNDACFSFVGLSLQADYVVLIEAASIETDLVVVLEAIATKNGSMLAQKSLQASTLEVAAGLRPGVEDFARRLGVTIRSADPFAAAQPASDAPTRMTLARMTDLNQEDAADLVAATPPRSRAPAYVAAGGAIAAAATTAALVAIGASASSCLNGPAIDGHPSVCVPREQAQALEQRANGSYSAAMVSGAVALALGAATVWLWQD